MIMMDDAPDDMVAAARAYDDDFGLVEYPLDQVFGEHDSHHRQPASQVGADHHADTQYVRADGSIEFGSPGHIVSADAR